MKFKPKEADAFRRPSREPKHLKAAEKERQQRSRLVDAYRERTTEMTGAQND